MERGITEQDSRFGWETHADSYASTAVPNQFGDGIPGPSVRAIWSTYDSLPTTSSGKKARTTLVCLADGLSSFLVEQYKGQMLIVEGGQEVYNKTGEQRGDFQYTIDVQYTAGSYLILNWNSESENKAQKSILKKGRDNQDPMVWKNFDFSQIHWGAKQMRALNQRKSLIAFKSTDKVNYQLKAIFSVFNFDAQGNEETSSFPLELALNFDNDQITSFEVADEPIPGQSILYALTSKGEIQVHQLNFDAGLSTQLAKYPRFTPPKSNESDKDYNRIALIDPQNKNSDYLCVSLWSRRTLGNPEKWKGLKLTIFEFSRDQNKIMVRSSFEPRSLTTEGFFFYNTIIYKELTQKLIICSFLQQAKPVRLDSKILVSIYNAETNTFEEGQLTHYDRNLRPLEEGMKFGSGRSVGREGDLVLMFNPMMGKVIALKLEIE